MSLAYTTFSPGDVSAWQSIGHSPSEAQKIASCFEAYWEARLRPREVIPARYFRSWLKVRAGEVPLYCANPVKPVYLSPESLPDTDPIHWYSVNGYRLYGLEEAVEIALAAAGVRPAKILAEACERYSQYLAKPRNPDDTRVTYSASRGPADIEFWQQLGHHANEIRAIAQCFPEYWFRLKNPWKWSVKGLPQNLWVKTDEYGEFLGSVGVGFFEG